MSKCSLVIVDDHPLFREGLKAIIAKDPAFEIVGEAADSRTGFDMVKASAPQIALIDLSLPDQSGIGLIRRIKESFPEIQILVVSMHSKVKYVSESLRAGARGYVLKESAAEQLLQGLRSVSSGNYFVDSSLSQTMEKLVDAPVEEVESDDKKYQTLTPREQEVFRLLAEGLTSKEIAERLFISVKTVDNHRTNILNKLDLHKPMDIFKYAARLGFLEIDLP